ncbi:AAA family ATPase [Edaphobacter acidisoli]|nr:AAA family ATPase [Edaphobacter acidisoli]
MKFGKSATSAPEVIRLSPITVFVGPNNSGKSVVLSEIQNYCVGNHQSAPNNKIIQSLGITPFSRGEAEELIEKYKIENEHSRTLPAGFVLFGRRPYQPVQVPREQLIAALTGPISLQRCQWYLQHATLILSGANRINLVNQQAMGDLRSGHPTSSFQVLFRDTAKRSEVRRVLYEAFAQHLVIDPSNGGHLRLVFSEREPTSEVEEQGLNEGALKYYREATPIEITSDGVKAFTGIITEIVAGDPLVLVVDEPEAFLHPPLAFQLGNEMSRLTAKANKNLFVSTHSSHFVMGCIQSGVPVNIIRLTYRAGVATARVLDNKDVFRLMRNPLLRSTGVLNALSYEFVVVTESDTDRAFYQEINERLLRFSPSRGIPNCLFLNAQNKQTVKTIIRPLRELGIPAAAIVDVDIIKDGGSEWSSFLKEGGFIPDIDCQALATSRKAVLDKFNATGKNMKKDGGIDVLSASDKEAANNLFDMLAKYGLFVLRRGELESWLSQLGATGKGTNWLVEIFERMGEDPEATGYVKPGTDDVWEFIAEMKQWFDNPNRNGIPS